MRQIIYLSDAKLEQFVEDPPATWMSGLLRKITASVKLPFAQAEVDLSLTKSNERSSKLDKVLESVTNDSKWYCDPSVTRGDWVLFESRLRCVVGRVDASSVPVVLFYECFPGASETGRRLILHGSARHLKGRNYKSSGLSEVDASSPDGYERIVGVFSSRFDRLLSLTRDDEAVVQRFLARHNRPVDFFKSSVMSGCALVSGVHSGRVEALVASPLYVKAGPEDTRYEVETFNVP